MEGFRALYRTGSLYRLTGVVLGGLQPEDRTQYGLFDDPARIERMERIYRVVDDLSARFGKHTVQHATSLPTRLQARHEGERGDRPGRTEELLAGENQRQRLGLPMLRMKI
jgi:hypothetical protein